MDQKFLDHIFKIEGGYVNLPADKGGPTNFGISIAVLAKWRGVGVDEDDVKNLTQEEAGNIYRVNYYAKCRLDQVADFGIALCIFDQAVLCGCSTAVTRAQVVVNKILGKGLIADGSMGPLTLKALENINGNMFGKIYLRESQLYFAGLCQVAPSQITFLKGWISRTHFVADAIGL